MKMLFIFRSFAQGKEKLFSSKKPRSCAFFLQEANTKCYKLFMRALNFLRANILVLLFTAHFKRKRSCGKKYLSTLKKKYSTRNCKAFIKHNHGSLWRTEAHPSSSFQFYSNPGEPSWPQSSHLSEAFSPEPKLFEGFLFLFVPV